jgi:hypothetical protein
MDAARFPQDAPNPEGSQAFKHAPAPRVVVELLDLAEICERWGFSHDRVYRAVARGRLHAYGRPGRQKYYSAAELIAVFGPPSGGPERPLKIAREDRGGNQQRFEFEGTRAA